MPRVTKEELPELIGEQTEPVLESKEEIEMRKREQREALESDARDEAGIMNSPDRR